MEILAHGTLDHAMAPQAMRLNIQCQSQCNLKLSNTNVQHENILFYFNLRWVYVGWKGDIGLSQKQVNSLKHGTLDHAMAP